MNAFQKYTDMTGYNMEEQPTAIDVREIWCPEVKQIQLSSTR